MCDFSFKWRRYDGIYKVVKYYPEKGLSGFRVWKYLLRRDDPSPAPWEPGAKQYSIIYPDGYLEAEAEKKALKEKKTRTKGNKKRALRESSQSGSEDDPSPPVKKRKALTKEQPKNKTRGPKKSSNKSPDKTIPSIFNIKSPMNKTKSEKDIDSVLTPEEKEAIEADVLNKKLWDECLEMCRSSGKKGFVEHVTQVFLCIICQDVTVNPVTTPCLHNFCLACLKLAFKSSERAGCPTCPCCRQPVAADAAEAPNHHLRDALRRVMPGYDAGNK